jgi:hypothetical protein
VASSNPNTKFPGTRHFALGPLMQQNGANTVINLHLSEAFVVSAMARAPESSRLRSDEWQL